jgi:hypothetical protein
VSIPPDYGPRRPDPRLLRDLGAIALLVVGVAGLIVAAFLQDRELGIATASAAVAATGVFLGLDR